MSKTLLGRSYILINFLLIYLFTYVIDITPYAVIGKLNPFFLSIVTLIHFYYIQGVFFIFYDIRKTPCIYKDCLIF